MGQMHESNSTLAALLFPRSGNYFLAPLVKANELQAFIKCPKLRGRYPEILTARGRIEPKYNHII